MGKINSTTLRDWNDGETVYSNDYEQDRSILQTAINDNYERLIKSYSVLNSDGAVKTTQSLDTAINFLKFQDTSTIVFSLDNTTSTLQLAVIDGSVTTSKLKDLGVTTAKIADGNVTTVKLANLNVTREKIADEAVNLQKIDLTSLDSRYYTEFEIDGKMDDIQGVGRTTETLKSNADNLTSHKTSADHDGRYYTETEVDTKVSNLQSQINSNDNDITSLRSKDDDLQAQITSNDTDITSVRSRLTTNETDINGLKAKDTELQTQIDNLNGVYSTDSERISAINDVINQFEIADDDLEVLISNKANKTDVYTKQDVWTKTEIESLVKFNQAVDAETGLVTGREVFMINHNMNDFPNVHVVAEKGYGHYGYGEGSFGIASDKFRLPVRVDYPDSNSLVISTDEHYEGTPSVTLNGNIARVTFSNEQVGLDVYLRGNS